MSRSLFAAFISVIFSLCSNSLFAQSTPSHSFELLGGIIFPMNSSNGLITSVQYSYSLSPKVQFYVYSAYSSWDKHNVLFHEDYSAVQKKQYFDSYSSDNHRLIPVYLGSRMNLHTNKLFTTFVNFEAGYTYYSYNSYENRSIVDEKTGAVLSYYADLNTRKEITENLLGIGIGAGISHPVSENMDLVLSFKLNSILNSSYYSFFSPQGTFTALSAGINYSI